MKSFLLHILAFLITGFALSTPLQAQFAVVDGKKEVLQKLEAGGEARRQAIWYIYQNRYDELLRPAIQYLFKSDDFDDHRAILRVFEAYGPGLERHVPDWYRILDRYMNRNVPEDILIQCIELASSWKEHRLIFALGRMADHPRMKVRLAAYRAMARMGNDNLIPILIRQMKSDRPVHKIYALEGARLYHDERLVPFIKDLLNDSSKSVRIFALKAIVEQRTDQDVSYLVARKYQDDTNEEVRARAIEMIGRKGWGRQNYLIHKAVGDSAEVVRWAAVRSAVAMKDRASAAPISRQLKTERSEDLKLAMIEALLDLRVDDSANALAYLLRTDEMEKVRQRAAMAIGNLRIRDGGFALLQAVRSDASVNVRMEAAAALGDLGDPSLAESIIALLDNKEEDRRVLQLSALAIIRSGSDEKIRKLERASESLSDPVLQAEIKRMVMEYRKNKGR
ncbi:MAG: HEAT repeat domain-containing protein [Leptospiraceae bacterium]|nr:HEAT repeat domain-containing protein [Leptospiraceae bacterium]MCB1170190.1 HEAT repeat domain-containing protein [Leptospiraceae bacterium]